MGLEGENDYSEIWMDNDGEVMSFSDGAPPALPPIQPPACLPACSAPRLFPPLLQITRHCMVHYTEDRRRRNDNLHLPVCSLFIPLLGVGKGNNMYFHVCV